MTRPPTRWGRTPAIVGARTALATLAAAVALSACDLIRPRQPWLRPGEPVLRDTHATGRLDSPVLTEGSGIVPSARVPGRYWALNDSGNESELFALDTTGHVRSVVRITGARNRDWEALASGPCAVGQCLFIGDIGDNGGRRASVQVYWLTEPDARVGVSSAPALGALDLRFADGPHDIEAMYAAPDGGLWFITKRPATRADGTARPVHLHRWAPGDTSGAPLPVIDSLPIVPQPKDPRDWITDASLSAPDASGQRRLTVLTYGSVSVFAADPVSGRPGALLGRCDLPIRETSSEGITWLPDGRVLVLNEGAGARLYAGACH